MSDDLVVSIEGADTMIAQMSGLANQIPYATSVAINTSLDRAQTAIRAKLPGEFTVRRKDFIEKTIYRSRQDFATKRKLIGAVRVNPARDQLAKFEEGGVKRPQGGKSLAVPVVRQAAPKMVITRGSPLALGHVMALIEHQGGKQVGPLKPRILRRKGQKIILPALSESFFVLHSAKGNTIVMQRKGKAKPKAIYAFVPEVPIPPSLHFVETASRSVLDTFTDDAEAAIAKAIETMK